MNITRPTDLTTALTRAFAAPRPQVFDAMTRPDQVLQWFRPDQMTLVSYEADFRVGGTSRYVFQRPSGKKPEMRHVYREVDAPKRWVYTESYDFSPLQIEVTVTLIPNPGGTVFTQTMRYPSKQARDDDFEPATGGAAAMYDKLERFLKSGG